MLNEKKGSPTNRKSIEDHPFYFGGYLSIARHNAYMVIKHLSAKYNTEDQDKLSEESLSQAKLFNALSEKFNKPDVTKAVISDLKKYFSLLNYPLFLALEADGGENKSIAFESDPETLRDKFKGLLTLLNSLRNHFSHYISSVDYSRFDFNPITQIYNAAIFRLIDRDKHTTRFDIFEKDHITHLQNKGKYLSEFYPHDLAESPNHENTVAFITCLFLERKYAFPFLSRLASFQSNYVDKKSKAARIAKASRECYTMFCTRLPQPKLESADIMLDMVNELARSPSALYNMLSDEDKETFHVARELLPESADDEIDTDEDWQTEVVLKRHSDRFPYFALRYFDDTEAFPTLRFDVSLGKWRTKPVYEKVIYDEKRERVLTKPLRTFARLKDFIPAHESIEVVNNRMKIGSRFVGVFREEWLSPEADGVYLNERIEQFSLKYNFGDQVIGLKFVPGKRAVKALLPKLPDPKNQKADAIISTYDLRGLFLYDYLHKLTVGGSPSGSYITTDAETFINDYLKRINQFFSDVKNGELQPLSDRPDHRKNEALPFVKGNREATKVKREAFNLRQEAISERKQELDELLSANYGLSIHNIPTKLKDYLLAYRTTPYRFRAADKLKQQQAIVKDLLKDVDRGRSPRVGEQATWLAEDIVFMTPPKIHHVDGVAHPQKLNNDQFRVLQSSLACFSANKGKIDQFLRNETHILAQNPQEAHPFLKSVDIIRQSGILSFYEDYLKAKAKWLDKALKKLRKLKNDKDAEKAFQYFLPSSINVKPATELDYTTLPVYLPRGFFDRAVVSALVAGNHFDIQPGDNMNECLKKMMASDTQSFYELDRLHRSIFTQRESPEEYVEESRYIGTILERRKIVMEEKANLGKLNKNEKQAVKNEYKDVTRERKRVMDRRQYIKSMQSDDRALWLMVQNRQKQKLEHTEIGFDQLQLRSISNLLKEPVQVRLHIPGSAVEITDELPLLRYGDLRRVAKDRRLENISLYYKADDIEEIPYDTIKLELERYDRRREHFFEAIYRFEELVYRQFQEEFPVAEAGETQHYHQHHVYVKIAIEHSSDTPFNQFFRNEASELRNKFYHNEFPWFEWLLPDVNQRKETLYSDRVFDIAEGYYQRMTDLISSK